MENIIQSINKRAKKINRQVAIMEVCGTHTMTVYRSGIKNILPKNVRLVSGPGCPVCVTDDHDISIVLDLAKKKEVIIASFGDFLKIPSGEGSLMDAKTKGADVRIIYSPLEIMEIAKNNPNKKVIYPGIGFETTTPLSAVLLENCIKQKLENIFILSMHKTIIPALKILEKDKESRIDGFILPGHVSVIIGSMAYNFMRKPGVIAGFDPKGVLLSIDIILAQIISGQARVENIYPAVENMGSLKAKKIISKFFKIGSSFWRGLGEISKSGFILRDSFNKFNAEKVFSVNKTINKNNLKGCLCGAVISGKAEPKDCNLFGKVCVPQNPYGPCMVSHEGTCANFYRYGEKNG